MPEGPSERSAPAESGEIATSTLAEIYAQQGLLGRALAIYRRMLSRAPEDFEIAGRIQRLERRIAETGVEAEAGAPGTGPAADAPGAAEPRERLPWDPPQEEPEAPPVAPEAPPRPAVGPIEAGAFAAWLEGR